MDGSPEGPLVVELPERVDRRLRLGPFPSARDALKFLAYAGVGSVLAISLSSPAGLVVIAGGFAVAVVRLDGEPVDRRILSILRFLFGLGRSGRTMSPRPVSELERRGFARGPAGELLAVVRAGGSPMAYLPPGEIARRFDRFRELLRSTSGDLVLFGFLAPMRPGTVLPGPIGPDAADRDARLGYSGLVRVLCHRRRIRRIDVVLSSTAPGLSGAADLQVRVEALLSRLAGLEVPARRLVGRSLLESLARVGALPSRSPP